MKKEFSQRRIFSYNLKEKKKFFFYSLLTFILLGLFILFYILKFKYWDFFLIRWINGLVKGISSNISHTTLIGSLYAAIFGGIFVAPIPLELIFIKFLKSGHPLILILLFYIIGLIISYSINYFIGARLTKLSKKVISTKKFYKVKGFLNRYGAWAIFIFNALPLPSQILSVVLGVFNYNKTKFYTFFIAGQIVKYAAITIGYFYIF